MLFNPPLLELLALAVFFSYFSLKASHASGLLDKPDQRKLHDGQIPLAGGPAIFLTFATAALLFNMPSATTGLVLYCTVFVVGLFDDHSNASAILRLIIHLVCGALMAMLCGIVITNVGNLLGFGNIPLLMFAVPLTALAFAGLTNAYNMIDGVDGLASGLALVPLAIVVTLIIQNQSMMPMPLIALIIALLVFMLFNLGPNSKLLPKMFLGDSGSSLLGFIICAVLIYQSQGPDALIRPVAALWLAAVPLIDMLTTVLLRLRAGLHPMKPDRRHLHHTLMDIGLSARQVTAALLSLSLVLGLFGIWISEISETLSMLLYCVLFLANCMYIFKTRRSLDAGPDKVPA